MAPRFAPRHIMALLSISSNHHYTVQMLSTDPVMIYLDGFIHPRETQYLLELG